MAIKKETVQQIIDHHTKNAGTSSGLAQWIAVCLNDTAYIKNNIASITRENQEAKAAYESTVKANQIRISEIQKLCPHFEKEHMTGGYELPSYSQCIACGKEL